MIARCIGGPDGKRSCGWSSWELVVAETHRQALAAEAMAASGQCPECGGQTVAGEVFDRAQRRGQP